MKYLVMEAHTSYAVVLDETGCFFIAANLGYEAGQEVEHPEIMREYRAGEKKTANLTKKIMGAVAAAAACLVLVFGVNSYLVNTMVYGSVFMTINPEVQIDINNKENVVSVTGLNDEGELLAAAQDYKGLPASEACAMLTEHAIEYGLLSDGGAVLFEVETDDTGFFEAVGTSIRVDVGAVIDGNVDADLYVTDYQDGYQIPARETETPNSSTGQSATIELNPSPKPSATPATMPAQDSSGTETQAAQAQQPAAPTQAPTPTQAPKPTQAPPTAIPAPVNDDSGYGDDGDSGYEEQDDDDG